MKVNLGKYNKNSDRHTKVTIERFDTYSLDHTLALVILPALLQLKENQQGIPNQFVQNVGGADYDNQDSFDFYKETHDDAFQIACKNWEITLDKMIWSFYQVALVDWEELYHHGTPKFEWVKSDIPYTNPANGKVEDTFQMVDLNPNEHWIDMEGLTIHRERIEEGLELFGKYYLNLWT
jgi:hypothetical protein